MKRKFCEAIIKSRKSAAVALAAVMTVGSIPAYGSDTTLVKDMPSNWAKEAVEKAVSNDILTGYEGYVRPFDNINRAEISVIINKITAAKKEADISSVSDVKEEDWFYSAMAKIVHSGIMTGSGNELMPTKNASREEAVVLIARLLNLENGDISVLDKFSDSDKISDWAKPYVAAMLEAGYINGDGNLLNPSSPVTRAEFVQILSNIADEFVFTDGAVVNGSGKTVFVAADNVTIKGDVEGSVIIGDGAGKVTLDGAKVSGDVVSRGGSLEFKDSAVEGKVVINNSNGTTGIEIDENSKVDSVEANTDYSSSKDIANVTGNGENVYGKEDEKSDEKAESKEEEKTETNKNTSSGGGSSSGGSSGGSSSSSSSSDSDSESENKNKNKLVYAYAAVPYNEYWSSEDIFNAGDNLSSDDPDRVLTDKSGKVTGYEYDRGGFDAVTRATTNHGLHRGSYQQILTVYDTEGTAYKVSYWDGNNVFYTTDGQKVDFNSKAKTVNGKTFDHSVLSGIKYVPVAVRAKDFDDFKKSYDVVENGGTLRGGYGELALEEYEVIADVNSNTNGLKTVTRNGNGWTFGERQNGTGSGIKDSSLAKAEGIKTTVKEYSGSFGEFIKVILDDDASGANYGPLGEKMQTVEWTYYGNDSTYSTPVRKFGTKFAADDWMHKSMGIQLGLTESARFELPEGYDGTGYWALTVYALGYEDYTTKFEVTSDNIDSIKNVSSVVVDGKEVLSDTVKASDILNTNGTPKFTNTDVFADGEDAAYVITVTKKDGSSETKIVGDTSAKGWAGNYETWQKYITPDEETAEKYPYLDTVWDLAYDGYINAFTAAGMGDIIKKQYPDTASLKKYWSDMTNTTSDENSKSVTLISGEKDGDNYRLTWRAADGELLATDTYKITGIMGNGFEGSKTYVLTADTLAEGNPFKYFVTMKPGMEGTEEEPVAGHFHYQYGSSLDNLLINGQINNTKDKNLKNGKWYATMTDADASDIAKYNVILGMHRAEKWSSLPEEGNGFINVLGTMYYYSDKEDITVNGKTVKGTKIGDTDIYYYAKTPLTGYIYGTANVPYADFYNGEINNVSAHENESIVTKTDSVADLRTQDGGYDAVSSATTIKWSKFKGSYSESNDDGTGGKILGVKSPVRIDANVYAQLKILAANKVEGTNSLIDIAKSITDISTTPSKQYKTVYADGTVSAMQNNGADALSYDDISISVTDNSPWGSYEFKVTGLPTELSAEENLLGIVLTDSDGKKYGLKHGDNIYYKKIGKFAFAIEEMTEPHGNSLQYKRFEGLDGKRITNVRYIVNGYQDISVNTDIYLKKHVTDPHITATAEPVTAEGETFNITLDTSALPESYDASLASISKDGVTLANDTNYTSSKDGKTITITLKSGTTASGKKGASTTVGEGTYTMVISDTNEEGYAAIKNITCEAKAAEQLQTYAISVIEVPVEEPIIEKPVVDEAPVDEVITQEPTEEVPADETISEELAQSPEESKTTEETTVDENNTIDSAGETIIETIETTNSETKEEAESVVETVTTEE